MNAQMTPSLTYVPREYDKNAFVKFGLDETFRNFIKGMQARALMLLMLSANSHGEVMYRAQGRAAELQDIVAVFEEFVARLGQPETAYSEQLPRLEGFQ